MARNMFTKRHYTVIAAALAKVQGAMTTPAYYGAMVETHNAALATELANVFEADNLEFDYKRFMAACGVKP